MSSSSLLDHSHPATVAGTLSAQDSRYRLGMSGGIDGRADGSGLTPSQWKANEARLQAVRQPVRKGCLTIQAEMAISKEIISDWHSKTVTDTKSLFLIGLECCDRGQIEAALQSSRRKGDVGLLSYAQDERGLTLKHRLHFDRERQVRRICQLPRQTVYARCCEGSRSQHGWHTDRFNSSRREVRQGEMVDPAVGRVLSFVCKRSLHDFRERPYTVS